MNADNVVCIFWKLTLTKKINKFQLVIYFIMCPISNYSGLSEYDLLGNVPTRIQSKICSIIYMAQILQIQNQDRLNVVSTRRISAFKRVYPLDHD